MSTTYLYEWPLYQCSDPRWKHYEWPPSRGYCPVCSSETTLIGESYGRYYYGCSSIFLPKEKRPDCPHADNVKNPLIYARLPWLWVRMRYGPEMSRHFPNILTPVLFECKDGELVHVMAVCSSCKRPFSGMYSPEATAGFVFETKEQEGWQKHYDDPVYTTSITCDDCLEKMSKAA